MAHKVNVLEVISKISQVVTDINTGAQLFNDLAAKYEGKVITYSDVIHDIMPQIARELPAWKKYTNDKGDKFIDIIIGILNANH